MTEVSFSELFARALHGVPCEVVPLPDAHERGVLVDLDPGLAEQLPLDDWRHRAVESDLDVPTSAAARPSTWGAAPDGWLRPSRSGGTTCSASTSSTRPPA